MNGHSPNGHEPGLTPGGIGPDDTWKIIAAILRHQGATQAEALELWRDLPEWNRPDFFYFARAAGCGYEIGWVF